MNSQKIDLGKRLTELRGIQRLKTVSKRTGIPLDYLERLEDGTKVGTPSAHALYKLAQYYKCEFEELARLGGLIVKARLGGLIVPKTVTPKPQ